MGCTGIGIWDCCHKGWLVTCVKEEPGAVACTLKSEFSVSAMAVIYVALMLIKTEPGSLSGQCRWRRSPSPDRASLFWGMSVRDHPRYHCNPGMPEKRRWVGLITSCSGTFCTIFPPAGPYKIWTTGFCTFSFSLRRWDLRPLSLTLLQY